MRVVRTIKALRASVDGWRKNGQTIGLAPTMGALHDGHVSLVTHANNLADRSVASIFVNPRQFGPREDLTTYPCDAASDLEKLNAAGCDLVFAPAPTEVYPPGFQTSIGVDTLASVLCGASRPHFFGGVATIVCKLLNQCRPDVAVFGEKDYQQLLVIRRMVKDLDMDVAIASAPIVREKDGLAMSSRNAYLTDVERQIAASLNRVIAEAAARLEQGDEVEPTLNNSRAALAEAGFENIDYLEVRGAEDLSPLGLGAVKQSARVFAAVNLGSTRLIDNWPVTSGTSV